jgi:hypothetical protein
VRVLQPGGELDLPKKALDTLASAELGTHDFQCH